MQFQQNPSAGENTFNNETRDGMDTKIAINFMKYRFFQAERNSQNFSAWLSRKS